MSEMIERVAKAIAQATGRSERFEITPGTLLCARAAIEAMREPTPRMCDMGEGFNLRCACPNCDHEAQEKVAAGFRAMIDAALSDA